MKKTTTRYILACAAVWLLSVMLAPSIRAQRKITPVNNAATMTQAVNEFEGDTARINAQKRARMAHYHDANGTIIYIDTITGEEWVDSASIVKKKKMVFPRWHQVSVGIDIWNPVMRAFGQKYGLFDASVQLSLYNRYKPVFETGLGMAKATPSGNNYTYKSPVSPYFRIGADYNFLYTSTPDYQYTIGLRYGISPFKFSLTDISMQNDYWGEDFHPEIPSQRSTVGWFEFTMGLKVQLWGPISAGWTFRFHSILHESKAPYGKPWYIPGYGSRGSVISGSFTFTYTFNLNKTTGPQVLPESPEILLPEPTTDDPYTPGITDSSSQQKQALGNLNDE